jgi:hypothetical protein
VRGKLLGARDLADHDEELVSAYVISRNKDGGFSQTHLLILSMFATIRSRCDYRGMRKACRLVGLFFPRTNDVVISDGKRKFKIYLNDPYWINNVFSGFSVSVRF